MKPKKLKKLLASLSDVPLGRFAEDPSDPPVLASSRKPTWQSLPTKSADAIRNAIAEKIRRKERRKERKKARKGVPHYDWVSTPDVCIGVEGYVDSVGAFNLAQAAEARARILAQIPVAQASVRTGDAAVVALQECAAHIGMNASVESIPFILDNLPRIVKDLVVSSKWPTRAGGWEGCSSEDAELTRSVPNGGEPRHFRRLRPECSPVISEHAGFYRITWTENGDTLGLFLNRRDPRPVQKLSPEGTWAALEEAQEDHLDLAARLDSVAADLRLGAVDQDIVDLFQGVEALRKQKAVQS